MCTMAQGGSGAVEEAGLGSATAGTRLPGGRGGRVRATCPRLARGASWEVASRDGDTMPMPITRAGRRGVSGRAPRATRRMMPERSLCSHTCCEDPEGFVWDKT